MNTIANNIDLSKLSFQPDQRGRGPGGGPTLPGQGPPTGPGGPSVSSAGGPQFQKGPLQNGPNNAANNLPFIMGGNSNNPNNPGGPGQPQSVNTSNANSNSTQPTDMNVKRALQVCIVCLFFCVGFRP